MEITNDVLDNKRIVKIVGTIDTTTSEYFNDYLKSIDFKNDDIVID